MDPEEIKTVAELEDELGQFIGTEMYHTIGVDGIYLTDGIAYVAKRIDTIGLFIYVSVLIRLRYAHLPFQAWYLDVQQQDGVNVATLCMREDIGEPLVVRREIGPTNFPVGRFEFWAVRGYVQRDDDFVLMLKSEY